LHQLHQLHQEGGRVIVEKWEMHIHAFLHAREKQVAVRRKKQAPHEKI
jgi:hypothetical protein